FHPSAGNDEQPEMNGGDDGKDAAENPGAAGYRGRYPDAGGRLCGNHLPDRNQEEHYGMHQGDDGAFAVRENGESGHANRPVAEMAGPKQCPGSQEARTWWTYSTDLG